MIPEKPSFPPWVIMLVGLMVSLGMGFLFALSGYDFNKEAKVIESYAAIKGPPAFVGRLTNFEIFSANETGKYSKTYRGLLTLSNKQNTGKFLVDLPPKELGYIAKNLELYKNKPLTVRAIRRRWSTSKDRQRTDDKPAFVYFLGSNELPIAPNITIENSVSFELAPKHFAKHARFWAYVYFCMATPFLLLAMLLVLLPIRKVMRK